MAEQSPFFKRNKELNKYECTDCGKCLSGKRFSNWRRHYRLVHKQEIGGSSSSADTPEFQDNKDMLNFDEPAFTHVDLPQQQIPQIHIPKEEIKKKRLFESDAEEGHQSPKNDSEFEAIGKNVACKFRRMNEEQRLYAELLINKLLIHGIKERLQEETDFTGLAFGHNY